MPTTETRLPIFRERFIKLRTEMDMTQKEFADHIGISRPTVGFYESGKRIPDVDVLCKICTTCKVSSDYLLGLSGIRNNKNREVTAVDLGLSERAIEVIQEDNGLSEMLTTGGKTDLGRMISVVSLLIEEEAFERILTGLRRYLSVSTAITEEDEHTLLRILFESALSMPISERWQLERVKGISPETNVAEILEGVVLDDLIQGLKALKRRLNTSATDGA